MTTSLDTTVLEAVLAGRVVGPQDADWDAARAAWNLAVDQRPSFVVQVATDSDVSEVVRFARAAGLRVAPQGTGHNAGALGDLTATVLLRTDALREVTVDTERRIVRVGAGVLWGEVTDALAPHGLTALAGSARDVGVAGYLLGGGYSWLARRHGLGSSKIVAVELVTGDGELVRADADRHAELFWAVRGAGANVGVVTALEFEVLPMTEVYAGMLLFPMSRADEVLHAYAAWTDGLTDAATTAVRLLRFPPLPDLPPFLSGQQLCAVDGAIDLPADAAAALLAPLRALGPTMDTFAVMPTAALGQIHLDPPGPVPASATASCWTRSTTRRSTRCWQQPAPRRLGVARGGPAPPRRCGRPAGPARRCGEQPARRVPRVLRRHGPVPRGGCRGTRRHRHGSRRAGAVDLGPRLRQRPRDHSRRRPALSGELAGTAASCPGALQR